MFVERLEFSRELHYSHRDSWYIKQLFDGTNKHIALNIKQSNMHLLLLRLLGILLFSSVALAQQNFVQLVDPQHYWFEDSNVVNWNNQVGYLNLYAVL